MSHPGRLRYLPWLFRDAVQWPGLIYLASVVVIPLMIWRARSAQADVVPSPEGLLAAIVGALASVVSLLAAGGMIGADLESGYYRIWFSKAIRPESFYLQRIVVGMVVVQAWVVALAFGITLAVGGDSQLTTGLLSWTALCYVLVVGCVTLVSHLTSRAWLFVFLSGWAQGLLAMMVGSNDDGFSSVKLVHLLLPPLHLIRPGRDGSGPPPDVLLHAGGYGLAALVLAMIILQRRSLGSGGRA